MLKATEQERQSIVDYVNPRPGFTNRIAAAGTVSLVAELLHEKLYLVHLRIVNT